MPINASDGQRVLVLVRTRAPDPHNRAFVHELSDASGHDVRLLVDARATSVPLDSNSIAITAAALAALDIFVPHDVGWRCGDYGLYVAARLFPDYDYYWVMDDDLRIAGDAQSFFRLCADRNDDLLGVNYGPAKRDWYWWPHSRSCDAAGFTCVFPVIRLSRRAVSACYQKRREQSRKWYRRAMWPNDETLVATTIAQRGFEAADFKELDEDLYSPESFFVAGDAFTIVPRDGPPRLMHPVRYAPRAASVPTWRARLEKADNLVFRVRVAVMRRVNSKFSW